MFFYKTGLVRRVQISPQYAGGKQDPLKVVRKKLKQDITEYSFSSEYGYIVDRIAVTSIKDGICLPISGFIEFVVTFEAIVLFPIEGEVIDAVVEAVSDTCVIFRHVCIYGVVRSYCLHDAHHYEYEERDVVQDKKQCGTFKEGLFRSKIDSDRVIQKGTAIRLRIINRTLGANGFFLVGSMFSEHLGPIITEPPVNALSPGSASTSSTSPPSSQDSFEDEPMLLAKLTNVHPSIIPPEERKKIQKRSTFFLTASDEEDSVSVDSPDA